MTEPTFVEEHVLRDGTRVRIRPIRPDDARTLQDGFAQLSPESRRRRFRGPKRRLSDDEVRFFTECDGHQHLALGAVRLDEDGWECEGLGVARYVCLPEHPEVAEPSVTVLDAAQGRGLGRLLSEALIRAAAANGVKHFRALLVDEHEWLRDRIHRSYPEARLTRRGQHLGADFPLPALAPRDGEAHGDDADDGRFWNLLRWVAQGSVRPDRPGALRRAAGRIASRLRPRSGADDEAPPA
ncbi:MAG TPA: GNAT family N-acetyltransferase [Myxococcota bacterium]|nr:GNAT family N-acetyltransferase [Myxococcota bacterium]